MTLFEMAIRAKLPLIAAQTNDLINIRNVIRFYAGPDATVIMMGDGIKYSPEDGNEIFVHRMIPPYPAKDLYAHATEKGCTMIVLDPEYDVSGYGLDVGTVPVPEKLLAYVLGEHVGELAPEVMPDLQGLDIKTACEVVQMCSANYNTLDSRDLRQCRRLLVPPTPGLEQIRAELGPTITRPDLQRFLSRYKWFFDTDTTGPLSPRGLMLTGAPGTGKTHMAKMLAKELAVPLYRASLAGAMDRWHGQSEQNLRRVLQAVENEAPCVLLLDEIEKEISSDDSGVSARMLAMLLWWLSEHRSKVITVMTTNDLGKVPPELYRKGRINEVIEVGGLSYEEALELSTKLIESYREELPELTLSPTNQEWIESRLAIDQTLTPVYIVSVVEELIRSKFSA